MICDDDDSALLENIVILLQNHLRYLQTDVLAERDITRDSKVIGFKHVGNGLESAQVFSDLKINL